MKLFCSTKNQGSHYGKSKWEQRYYKLRLNCQDTEYLYYQASQKQLYIELYVFHGLLSTKGTYPHTKAQSEVADRASVLVSKQWPKREPSSQLSLKSDLSSPHHQISFPLNIHPVQATPKTLRFFSLKQMVAELHQNTTKLIQWQNSLDYRIKNNPWQSHRAPGSQYFKVSPFVSHTWTNEIMSCFLPEQSSLRWDTKSARCLIAQEIKLLNKKNLEPHSFCWKYC